MRNDGAEQVAVDVLRRTVVTRWLQISPERLHLGPGRSASLTLRAKTRRDAEPGDHQVLVPLTTRPQHGSRVALRLRLGVRVRVRMPEGPPPSRVGRRSRPPETRLAVHLRPGRQPRQRHCAAPRACNSRVVPPRRSCRAATTRCSTCARARRAHASRAPLRAGHVRGRRRGCADPDGALVFAWWSARNRLPP